MRPRRMSNQKGMMMEIEFDYDINDKVTLKIAAEVMAAISVTRATSELLILVVRERQFCQDSTGSTRRYWCRPYSLTASNLARSESLVPYGEDELCKLPPLDLLKKEPTQ